MAYTGWPKKVWSPRTLTRDFNLSIEPLTGLSILLINLRAMLHDVSFKRIRGPITPCSADKQS